MKDKLYSMSGETKTIKYYINMQFHKERVIPFLVSLIIVTGLDRWTKWWAIEELMNEPMRSFTAGFFRLKYAENRGAFLSLGAGVDGWLGILALKVLPVVLLLGLVVYIFFNKQLTKWYTWSFALVFAGGIGNIWDRLADGYVVDFMIMGVKKLQTGVFNVADVSIMTGLFMLLFASFIPQKNTAKVNPEQIVKES